jgi:c(7)-type cytochrome triheme protein
MERVSTFLALVYLAASLGTAGTAFAAVGGGDMSFKPKNAKPVLFSHEKHVDEKKKKCSACHYHAFQMAKGSYKMDMSKMTKGQFCGVCHNGERSFDVKDKASCDKCHK